MMATVDRSDPVFREAMDQAARAAEWLLDAHNDDAEQELALDVLNEFITGPITSLPAGLCRGQALAWAFALTERRTDLSPHEERLLELAWGRVKDDALLREWEEGR